MTHYFHYIYRKLLNYPTATTFITISVCLCFISLHVMYILSINFVFQNFVKSTTEAAVTFVLMLTSLKGDQFVSVQKEVDQVLMALHAKVSPVTFNQSPFQCCYHVYIVQDYQSRLTDGRCCNFGLLCKFDMFPNFNR